MKQLISLLTLIAFGGCQYDAATKSYVLKPAVKAELQASLKQLGQAAVSVANNTVAVFATSELDALVKNNFVQSSGDLLRTLENSAITAGTAQIAPTVEQQLQEWLPDKSHWQNYATQIASLINAFAKDHPNDPAALNAALETVATYLNTTTVVLQQTIAPTPTPTPTNNVAFRDRIILAPKVEVWTPTSGAWTKWPETIDAPIS